MLRVTRGKLNAVVLSILAHSWPDGIQTLLMVVYPGHEGLTPPFYASAGSIAVSGQVVADMACGVGDVVKNSLVYDTKDAYQSDMRRVADSAKLNDKERMQFFETVRRWIVADRRVGPHGERIQ